MFQILVLQVNMPTLDDYSELRLRLMGMSVFFLQLLGDKEKHQVR